MKNTVEPLGDAGSSSRCPKVQIVLLNWNGWQDTLACLASLQGIIYSNYEIILVDNASSDGSVDKVRDAYPSVKVLRSQENLGFAAGNNVGIRQALENGADYVWLLNNDTVVEPDSLSHLVQRMKERPEAGMCGSTLVYYENRERVQALAGARYNKWLGVAAHIGDGIPRRNLPTADKVESQMSYIVAASMLVSRSFIETVGPMNESYFLYYEELDWSTRARGCFSIVYAPKSVVFHKKGSSIGTSKQTTPAEKRFRSEYFMVRSRLIFTRRYFPAALPTVYLGIVGTVLIRLLRGEPDRALTLARVLWSLLTRLDLPRALSPRL
jgi:GT2 family glycosyltransferase